MAGKETRLIISVFKICNGVFQVLWSISNKNNKRLEILETLFCYAKVKSMSELKHKLLSSRVQAFHITWQGITIFFSIFGTHLYYNVIIYMF